MKQLKKLISLLLCPAMMLCTCACAAGGSPEDTTDTTPADTTPLSDGKTLKLLAITSSFGMNTTDLLYDVAKAEGCTDVIVGQLYASGCTLEQHAKYAKENSPAYRYTKNSTGTWETMHETSLRYGLEDEDWDIIFIQQSAAQSGQGDSYKDYLDQIFPYVNAYKTNPNAKFIWNMTWAYENNSDQPVFKNQFKNDQNYMYNCIVNVLKEKILPRTEFSAIIPSGTAIQNVRTSYIGDTLTKDTFHLNNFGKVIASYTLFSVLVGRELTAINLEGEIISRDYDVPVTLSEKDKQAIIEAVNSAIKNPYEVTPSTFTQP